jgi:hypothetical protein
MDSAPSGGAKLKAQNLKHVKHVARKPMIPRFLAPSGGAKLKAQNLKHVKHVARKAGILSFFAPLPPSGGSCYGQESPKVPLFLCPNMPSVLMFLCPDLPSGDQEKGIKGGTA